jgi:hypothetical protein
MQFLAMKTAKHAVLPEVVLKLKFQNNSIMFKNDGVYGILKL